MLHAREDYNRIQDPAGLIPDDEPVFLLRAQDETAATIVRFWAALQKEKGGRASLLALEQADRMDAWPTKKPADVPGSVPIEDLELSVRAYNGLRWAGIKTLEELASKTAGGLLRIKNFGRKSLREVMEVLEQHGLVLKG